MSQYFCHTCNTRIERINDDYTCPSCSQGFIEELDQNEIGGGGVGPGNSPINPLDFLQLIGLASQGGGGFPINASGRRRNPAGPNSGTTTASTDDQQQGGGATGGGNSQSESQSPSGRSSRGHRHHHHGPHFSFVLDTRAGGGGVPGAGGAAATGGSGGNAEIPVENMFLNFITDLLTGLGGGHQQQLNFGGLGIPLSGNINLGDYAWGREGFDAIVTQLMNNMEGTGPAPLTTEKLSELNNISISQEQVEAKLQCSVCWEDFTIGENVIRLDCEHIYHHDCILPWLKLHGTCPVCRKDLNQPNDEMKDSTTIDDHHHVPASSSNSTEEQQHRQQNNPNSNSNTLDEDMEFD